MLEKQMGRFLLLPFINNNQCKLRLTNAYSQRWRWLYLEEGRAFNCGNCFNPLSQIKEQQQKIVCGSSIDTNKCFLRYRHPYGFGEKKNSKLPVVGAFSRITQFATSASLEARKENYYRSIFPLSRFSTALEFGVKGESAHSRILDNHEMEGKENIIKPMVEFSKVDIGMLPSAILVGRPNVGKSALFNRLIRRREALVYNTLDDHVTRDIREGVAKLGDLRFKVLDSAGLEMVATSGSILDRTAGMTANVLARSHFAIFLTDARDGLQPLDLEVGKWLRKNAPGIRIVLVMNKSESLDEHSGSLTGVVAEAHSLGFGDPIPISAETGFGMVELYEALRPLLEEYMIQKMEEKCHQDENATKDVEAKLPLQLAIVGRPNVGKSTLLNALLQQERVLVGPEAGLTRDSVRTQFEFQGRTIYLVDTAGWLDRTKQERGLSSLSVMQARKNLMRAHVVALVLDGEEIAKAKSSMRHAEVVIARRAVEEGRGLVVVVNKMDLLRGRQNTKLYEKVIKAVLEEIQTLLPEVTGIPVVFVSALEGRGRTTIMKRVVEIYEKWCLRLPTARLNCWLRKVMSRHSWKDQAAQPKIKYFTQVKARPPTFVAFVSGSTELAGTEIRFFAKSLKEDFNLGGIPIRITQRCVPRNRDRSLQKSSSAKANTKSNTKTQCSFTSDKRMLSCD
ncbi:uncharacterized protein LOC18434173 [Amborella trichopoda]|uniref:uncharacterized protein LOC18434173 n=1 Tax=Amborella trichopoda TaxID=13333 RepID=UPI0005D3D8A6|nr:uncharacterized protein LOC18434173 [Amborella trichopoda]XP_011623348.1 uncharacterized protein LOC18434173 [Amborella trichopoda]|eukprot:XP_011623347.1 uncharacterized protein LOC18434173 [Amborella trichopoda]